MEGKPAGVRRLPVLIETALGEALLRHKRLIPILDHASELPELPELARQQLVRNLPAGLVITTGRSLDHGYHQLPLSRIEPLQIATDRLQSFFLDYLRQQGQGEVLKDDDLVPAQNQLRRIADRGRQADHGVAGPDVHRRRDPQAEVGIAGRIGAGADAQLRGADGHPLRSGIAAAGGDGDRWPDGSEGPEGAGAGQPPPGKP
jgi:hypothetical protein